MGWGRGALTCWDRGALARWDRGAQARWAGVAERKRAGRGSRSVNTSVAGMNTLYCKTEHLSIVRMNTFAGESGG